MRLDQLCLQELHQFLPSVELKKQFNQGMMDLGATICKPVHPLCSRCPIQKECLAFKNKQMDVLPINIKKIKKHYKEVCIKYLEADFITTKIERCKYNNDANILGAIINANLKNTEFIGQKCYV